MSTRIFVLTALTFALLFAGAAAGGAAVEPAGEPDAAVAAAEAAAKPDTVERMAGEIISHFPRAEGLVTRSGDKTIAVGLGLADGVGPGMKVLLFRPGKPIRHPVTKEVLGSHEESLGSAVLADVGEDESEADVTELLVTRIVDGDIARLPTDRDALVLAVFGKEYNELVLDRLLNELRASGRFEIKGPVELDAEAVMDEAGAASLAGQEGADAVLTLVTAPTTDQDRTDVEMALYSRDGARVERQVGEVDITSEIYGEMVMEYPLVRGDRRDFFRLENLPYRAKQMASGDVTGDGLVELVVSDGRGLVVYRYEESILTELWRDEGRPVDQHLDVECADLNKNGKDEIYVTNFVDGVMESFVVEYDGESFKRIYGPSGMMFRVLDVPGSGKTLITTSMGTDTPYSGIIRQYRWEDGRLKKAEDLALPRKIKDPYGFVLMDLVPDRVKKDGTKVEKSPFESLEIVWVDDADYIQVLRMDGKRVWKSPERFGGYDNFFESGKKDSLQPNIDSRGKVKGRLIVRDGPDGTREIVLAKNIAVTYITQRFRGYSGAEIYSLFWNGTEMEVRWSIRNIEGYLADISVGVITNDGRENIAVITAPTFKVQKKSKNLPVGGVASLKDIIADRSSMLVYKMPQR